ncbi:hypothetical protein B0H14DRAFT_3518286 [Mycena olivaceomarginata]|nr:hypothetical protein B0H14DRAFT_3518286 [Mycena olivaceomarginata]
MRFCYDTAVGGVVKVGEHVAFGPELGVGNDSRTSLLKLSFDAGLELMHVALPLAPPNTTLTSTVVYYHGVLCVWGALHAGRAGSAAGTGSEHEGWVRIDDELVSNVRPVDVFGAPEGDSLFTFEQPQAPQTYGADYHNNNVYAPGSSNPNGYSHTPPQQQYNGSGDVVAAALFNPPP